jgi:hypothetical protein
LHNAATWLAFRVHTTQQISGLRRRPRHAVPIKTAKLERGRKFAAVANFWKKKPAGDQPSGWILGLPVVAGLRQTSSQLD